MNKKTFRESYRKLGNFNTKTKVFLKNVFVLKNVLCNINYNTFINTFINMNTLFYTQLYTLRGWLRD